MADKKSNPTSAGGIAPELSSYGPVEVTVPKITFPEDTIDEQIAQLAQQMTIYVKAEDREIRPDDQLYIAMETVQDGAPLENLSGERHISLADSFMPDGFKDQVAAMKVGETKTFDYDAPTAENDAEGNAITAKVTSTVTVLEIQEEAVPEVTDEWVKKSIPGANSIEELRRNVRTQMESKAAGYSRSALYEQCAAELASRLTTRIPDDVFERGIQQAHSQFLEQLKQQNIEEPAYLLREGITKDQLNMQLMIQGREIVAEGMALEAMANHLHLKVTDKDIDASFGNVSPAQAAQMRKAYEEKGLMPELRRMALCGKALDSVVANAKISYRELMQTDLFGGEHAAEAKA